MIIFNIIIAKVIPLRLKHKSVLLSTLFVSEKGKGTLLFEECPGLRKGDTPL